MHSRSRTGAAITAALAVCALAVCALAACVPASNDGIGIVQVAAPVELTFAIEPDIRVIENIRYTDDATLDLCLPADATGPHPAIVSIHGGSWQRGDKADPAWRSICQWFASEGFVTVSVNYRLAPEHVFPAQLHDVQDAVRWLRDPAQVERYDIDPDRIGAFGASAGGNLAALLGVTGSGSHTAGARVAAVAALSGLSDVRRPITTGPGYSGDFAAVQLQYVGCADFSVCATAAAASPITLVDRTDAPFLLAHSLTEFIPIAQSGQLADALRAAGIETTYLAIDGTDHAIKMLDEALQRELIAFFRATLT